MFVVIFSVGVRVKKLKYKIELKSKKKIFFYKKFNISTIK